MNKKKKNNPRMTKDQISSQIEECIANCLTEGDVIKIRLPESAKETLAQRIWKLLFKNRRY